MLELIPCPWLCHWGAAAPLPCLPREPKMRVCATPRKAAPSWGPLPTESGQILGKGTFQHVPAPPCPVVFVTQGPGLGLSSLGRWTSRTSPLWAAFPWPARMAPVGHCFLPSCQEMGSGTGVWGEPGPHRTGEGKDPSGCLETNHPLGMPFGGASLPARGDPVWFPSPSAAQAAQAAFLEETWRCLRAVAAALRCSARP